MDVQKPEIERVLRAILRELPPELTYTTRDVSRMVAGHLDTDPLSVADHIQRLGKSPYNLAQVGPPEPAPTKSKPDAVKRRLIWRRLDAAPATAYAIPPSQMRLDDALGSIIQRRGEAGTFGPASRVRSVHDRLDDIERRIARLEAINQPQIQE